MMKVFHSLAAMVGHRCIAYGCDKALQNNLNLKHNKNDAPSISFNNMFLLVLALAKIAVHSKGIELRRQTLWTMFNDYFQFVSFFTVGRFIFCFFFVAVTKNILCNVHSSKL